MTDPEPTQEQVDRLVSIFMSGFASGISTLMVSRVESANRDAALTAESRAAVLVTAQGFAAAILEDPAVRLELGRDLTRLWSDGTAAGPRVMAAHIGHSNRGGRG